MKIFYAIQATGNGHISRAKQLLPYLQRYGDVDVFLSGSNSSLPVELPVKYRSPGFSLFYKDTGGLSYWDMMVKNRFSKSFRDIFDLPVDRYDVVINDFEFITSQACRLKNVPSVHFGHQASFHSTCTPRPEKRELLGEFVLTKYAVASQYLGLHFQEYDHFIKPPVIKKECLRANPKDHGHITVYLPSYDSQRLIPYFHQMPDVVFHTFAATTREVTRSRNVVQHPISNTLFTDSLINCHGILTGAGFETPAEALYLKKKLIAIPIHNHYEQKCNGAALSSLGATVWGDINFDTLVRDLQIWIDNPYPEINIAANNVAETIEYLLDTYPRIASCGIAS